MPYACGLGITRAFVACTYELKQTPDLHSHKSYEKTQHKLNYI